MRCVPSSPARVRISCQAARWSSSMATTSRRRCVALFVAAGFADIVTARDLAGIPRVVAGLGRLMRYLAHVNAAAAAARPELRRPRFERRHDRRVERDAICLLLAPALHSGLARQAARGPRRDAVSIRVQPPRHGPSVAETHRAHRTLPDRAPGRTPCRPSRPADPRGRDRRAPRSALRRRSAEAEPLVAGVETAERQQRAFRFIEERRGVGVALPAASMSHGPGSVRPACSSWFGETHAGDRHRHIDQDRVARGGEARGDRVRRDDRRQAAVRDDGGDERIRAFDDGDETTLGGARSNTRPGTRCDASGE